jgi:hypothetical protein
LAAENIVTNARRALIGCALVAGAAGFFCLGILVSQHMERRQEQAHPPAPSNKPSSQPYGRKIFSPSIADDPYVVQQWKESVEALERRCRDANEFCAEARNARVQIKEIQ